MERPSWRLGNLLGSFGLASWCNWRRTAGQPTEGVCAKEGVYHSQSQVAVRIAPSQTVNYAGGTGTKYAGSDYCKGWGGSDSCSGSPDTAGWSKAAAEHLSTEADSSVGQWVASKIDPGTVDTPYGESVPNCKGLLWTPCKEQIEDLELVPERSTVTWDKAEVEQPAQAVLEIPKAGHKVEVGSKVTVITNPDEADMPLSIPAPEPNETYDEYITRLAPQLKPHRVNVCEACIVPGLGPDAVTRVVPKPGTTLDPAVDHDVEVQANPADAPAAGTGTTGCGGSGIPGMNLSPLNQPLGSRFPFGVFAFFIGWVGEWEGCDRLT